MADAQKADQIAYRLYTKLYLILNDARTTDTAAKGQSKTDRWFNLETPDGGVDFVKLFKDSRLSVYKAITSPNARTAPPFIVQVLLSIPDLNNNQVLVYNSPQHGRVRVDPTPRQVLLEEWTLAFSPPAGESDVPPAMTYKHGIAVFRSVYALLRILPAWKLYKRLRRRTANSGLDIQLRIGGLGTDNGILKFNTPYTPSSAPAPTDTHAFPPIPHLAGTLALSVRHLVSPSFALDDLESLLSDRFLAEGPEFTPTLTKATSVTAFPHSRSPPSATSIADRFVLPAPGHGRTTSMSGGRAEGSPGAASVVSHASHASSGGSGSARLRRESTGTGRGELSSSPSGPGMSIRRPTLVNPFKSSTLSSSPSLHSPSPSQRLASPLSPTPAGPSLPGRPVASPAPISTRSVVNQQRPSPPAPFAPSSLGQRSNTSAEEAPSPVHTRKRYSSSFQHRYSQQVAQNAVAIASGGREGAEDAGSAQPSYSSTPNDDEDISVFMRDIEARKPLGLGGHQRNVSPLQGGSTALPKTNHDRERTVTDSPDDEEGPRLMRRQADVDEKLRAMNDQFLASLEGLGGRREGRGKEPARQDAASVESSQSSGSAVGRGRGLRGGAHRVTLPSRDSMGSGSGSGQASIGSQEVIGKLELSDRNAQPPAPRRGPLM